MAINAQVGKIVVRSATKEPDSGPSQDVDRDEINAYVRPLDSTQPPAVS